MPFVDNNNPNDIHSKPLRMRRNNNNNNNSDRLYNNRDVNKEVIKASLESNRRPRQPGHSADNKHYFRVLQNYLPPEINNKNISENFQMNKMKIILPPVHTSIF